MRSIYNIEKIEQVENRLLKDRIFRLEIKQSIKKEQRVIGNEPPKNSYVSLII